MVLMDSIMHLQQDKSLHFVKDEINRQKINRRIPINYIAPCPFWAMLWIKDI